MRVQITILLIAITAIAAKDETDDSSIKYYKEYFSKIYDAYKVGSNYISLIEWKDKEPKDRIVKVSPMPINMLEKHLLVNVSESVQTCFGKVFDELTQTIGAYEKATNVCPISEEHDAKFYEIRDAANAIKEKMEPLKVNLIGQLKELFNLVGDQIEMSQRILFVNTTGVDECLLHSARQLLCTAIVLPTDLVYCNHQQIYKSKIP